MRRCCRVETDHIDQECVIDALQPLVTSSAIRFFSSLLMVSCTTEFLRTRLRTLVKLQFGPTGSSWHRRRRSSRTAPLIELGFKCRTKLMNASMLSLSLRPVEAHLADDGVHDAAVVVAELDLAGLVFLDDSGRRRA